MKQAVLIISLVVFLTPTGLYGDQQTPTQKSQEQFIRAYGFTPGWYALCHSRSQQGCQAAKEAVLSDPYGNDESVLFLKSDGSGVITIKGKSLPKGSEVFFKREGHNIRVNCKTPGRPDSRDLFFKPGLDSLDSTSSDDLYILVIDEVSMQSAN